MRTIKEIIKQMQYIVDSKNLSEYKKGYLYALQWVLSDTNEDL